MIIKPCIGHISGTWELLLCEYWRKSMIIGEKNTDLKRLTGRLKLRFLTEIGRLHWNQGEEVTHFAWFGEPCSYMSQEKLESHESWNCLLTFFFCYNANGRFWFLLLTCTCDSVVITLSLLKSLIISNAWSISHVYICKQHINKDQYRFYVLNYLDFTLLSSAKMMITKIESTTENYPEFPVANLNYAGGHAGHQI